MATSDFNCFFLVSVAGEKPRRLTFQLATHIAPKTCQNFISFCRGAGNVGTSNSNSSTVVKAKSYKGTTFHRIIKGFIAQGGDYEKGDGSGGEAFEGKGGTLPDESFDMKHDGPGILSMANRGKNTAGSQFFITLGNASHLNGKHVAFGKVVEGMDVVRRMEEVETDDKDKPVPMQRVVIVDCGIVGEGDRNHNGDGNSNGDKSDDYSSSSSFSRKEADRKASSSRKRSKKKSRKRERKSSRSRDSKRRDRDSNSSDSETGTDSDSHNDRRSRSRREKKRQRETKRRRRDDDRRRRRRRSDSESDSDDYDDDDDGGDKRSRARDRQRKSKSSRKDKKRSRDRDRDRSHRRRHSSEEDVSSSNDDDSRRKSSSKIDKKSKRDKKDSKKRRKEGKKDRDRDYHSKRSDKCSSASAAEASFGKYGIVRDSDLFSSAKLKRTFEIWLEEVKSIPRGSNMAKWEVSDYFKTFAEDFNTCTMPHMKYYDYEKWEMEEYAKKKKEALEEKGGGIGDEFEYQEEQKRKIEMKRRKEIEMTRLMMSKEKIEDMKRQARLKTEMVNAYRVGDEKTRMRLQKKLEPEDK